MHKKSLILFFSLILLFSILPIISSAPPVLSTIQGGSLEILAPTYNYVTQGEDKDIYWHVFNTSNLLTNKTTSCNYHLYSQQLKGEHIISIFNVNQFTNGRDFEVKIEGANFSIIGEYCHLIECNTSSQTGGIERCFTVTPNGEETSTGKAIFYIGILLILVIFLIGCVVLFMENDNLLAKVGFFGLGYLLLITITFISWNMASDFILSAPFLIAMFRILFFVLVIGAFPLLIGAFIWYFLMLWKIREIENLMKHGMSSEDAERRISKK